MPRRAAFGRLRKRTIRRFRIKPAQLVWIFGFPRSGTTWLATMLCAAARAPRWNEPHVGDLFGEFYLRTNAARRPANFIMSPAHRETWLRGVREMVLQGSAARFPELPRSQYVIVKEPNGLVGAPLLSAALPESRMVLMMRDPRDVVASVLDGQRAGGWTARLPFWGPEGMPPSRADSDPDGFVRETAQLYVRNVEQGLAAFESHAGPKALARYEDLRRDPVGGMERLCSALAISVAAGELKAAVEKSAWERIPHRKGPGQFHRKASPGAWRDDLTAEQARAVEEAAAPILREFYPRSAR